MDKSTQIGAEIRKNLYLQGENQKWLAKKIGMSEGAISSIVCGRSKPSQKTLKKIATALSVETEALVSCLFGRRCEHEN